MSRPAAHMPKDQPFPRAAERADARRPRKQALRCTECAPPSQKAYVRLLRPWPSFRRTTVALLRHSPWHANPSSAAYLTSARPGSAGLPPTQPRFSATRVMHRRCGGGSGLLLRQVLLRKIWRSVSKNLRTDLPHWSQAVRKLLRAEPFLAWIASCRKGPSSRQGT